MAETQPQREFDLGRTGAWGYHRIQSGRFAEDDAEWVFAFRWCLWCFLLEGGGGPGTDVWDLAFGLASLGRPVRRLMGTVLRFIARRELGHLEGRRNLYIAKSPLVYETIFRLWRWLARNIPAQGYPPGW
jgi:hypothetical protein